MEHIIIKIVPIKNNMSHHLLMLIPLFLLSIRCNTAGFVFKEIFIGHNGDDFGKTSIFFLKNKS